MSGLGQGLTRHAASLVGEKREESIIIIIIMFQCNKITLEVCSQLFNEDHVTSV